MSLRGGRISGPEAGESEVVEGSRQAMYKSRRYPVEVTPADMHGKLLQVDLQGVPTKMMPRSLTNYQLWTAADSGHAP